MFPSKTFCLEFEKKKALHNTIRSTLCHLLPKPLKLARETSLFTSHLRVRNLGVALKLLMRQRELSNILCDKYFVHEVFVGTVITKPDMTEN